MEFQSRNRETFDSNQALSGANTQAFAMFQSRNRETFDSNNSRAVPFVAYTDSFNLVIEKLLIPTLETLRTHDHRQVRFNLVIEKLLIPT